MSDSTRTRRENRETAFRVWRECGRNFSEAARELNAEHGFAVTRQTLSDWAGKYGWVARADGIEAKTAAVTTGNPAIDMLADLIRQKERYDEYFDTLPPGERDNQATYAYTNLVKVIIELSAKIEKMTGKDRKKPAGGLSEATVEEIKREILGLESDA